MNASSRLTPLRGTAAISGWDGLLFQHGGLESESVTCGDVLRYQISAREISQEASEKRGKPTEFAAMDNR